MVVARYWTAIFAVLCALSYLLVFPFVLVFPAIEQAIGVWDAAHYGVGVNLFSSAYFWVAIITVYLMVFGLRCAAALGATWMGRRGVDAGAEAARAPCEPSRWPCETARC